MELGVDGVFVGSGIFKGENPSRARARWSRACTHYNNPATVARVSTGLGKAMVGLLENEPGQAVVDALPLKPAASASTTPSRPKRAGAGGRERPPAPARGAGQPERVV